MHGCFLTFPVQHPSTQGKEGGDEGGGCRGETGSSFSSLTSSLLVSKMGEAEGLTETSSGSLNPSVLSTLCARLV